MCPAHGDVSMVWTLSEASLWEFVQAAPNQRAGWVGLEKGEQIHLVYRQDLNGMEEMSELALDTAGWNEESCMEAQKCFVVEGI